MVQLSTHKGLGNFFVDFFAVVVVVIVVGIISDLPLAPLYRNFVGSLVTR